MKELVPAFQNKCLSLVPAKQHRFRRRYRKPAVLAGARILRCDLICSTRVLLC